MLKSLMHLNGYNIVSAIYKEDIFMIRLKALSVEKRKLYL